MRSVKWIYYMLGCVGLGLLGSCTDDESDMLNDPSNQLVVEAYVYADEPIGHVRISKIHSGGSALPVPVNAANVRIVQDNIQYQLSQVDTLPGMYMQSDTTQFLSGYGRAELLINYDGRQISAQTQMPTQITGLSISDSLIYINPGDEDNVLAVLSWDPIENTRYVLSIRNVGEDAEIIGFLEFEEQNNPFLTLSDQHKVELKGGHFRHYGRYEIYVSAIRPEYELFYNQFTGLANAPSNISGGLGIFTAFNGAAVKVHVQ